MRNVLLLAVTCIIVLTVTTSTLADTPIDVQLRDQTVEPIPLHYSLQKATFDGQTVFLWGTIVNRAAQSYHDISITFTAKDKNGQFLGRNTWYAESPGTLGFQQQSTLDANTIETGGKKPATIDYVIEAKQAMSPEE